MSWSSPAASGVGGRAKRAQVCAPSPGSARRGRPPRASSSSHSGGGGGGSARRRRGGARAGMLPGAGRTGAAPRPFMPAPRRAAHPRFPPRAPLAMITCGPAPPPASLDEGEGGGTGAQRASGSPRRGRDRGPGAAGAALRRRRKRTCASLRPGAARDVSSAGLFLRARFLHSIRAPPGRSRRAREGRRPPQLSRVRRGICGSGVRPQEKRLLFSSLPTRRLRRATEETGVD